MYFLIFSSSSKISRIPHRSWRYTGVAMTSLRLALQFLQDWNRQGLLRCADQSLSKNSEKFRIGP